MSGNDNEINRKELDRQIELLKLCQREVSFLRELTDLTYILKR
jgi:hypothetical protein